MTTNEDKTAEYHRLYGVKTPHVHEKAFEISLYKKALKRQLLGRRITKRQGDIPKDKGCVVTITDSQHQTYTIIVESLIALEKDTIRLETLRTVGIRMATLKALEKAQLIQINNEEVGLWTPEETALEIMEKHNQTI